MIRFSPALIFGALLGASPVQFNLPPSVPALNGGTPTGAAAIKRAARKRRNIRRNASKRRGAR